MKPEKLSAKFCSIKKITTLDIFQMYSIYSQYYKATKWKIFLNDLSKKSGAFLIRRKEDKMIVGFSTITSYKLEVNNKSAVGIFSGDTIIDRRYWGTRTLQFAFYRYILTKKLLHPTKTVYWLLISKGFKTYLLLANNFYKFYPHPDNKYQEMSGIVDNYCQQIFPEYYNADRRILDFGDNYQSLKEGVADIDEAMIKNNKKISFFEERNPDWRKGTELPCVGAIDWSSLMKYVGRYLKKPVSKGFIESQRKMAAQQQVQQQAQQHQAVPATALASAQTSSRVVAYENSVQQKNKHQTRRTA